MVREYGVNHITSSPHYPQSNRLAAKYVGIVKNLFHMAKEKGDGSLTQMYMANEMVLVVLCASLPMMVKQSTLIGCPMAWLCW